MISLKMTKKEKDERSAESPKSESTPEYPWGTTLTFNDENVAKVGLEKADIDDEYHIEGIGKIVNISSHENSDGTKRQSVELQVQKIEIMTKPDANKKMRKEVADEVWAD